MKLSPSSRPVSSITLAALGALLSVACSSTTSSSPSGTSGGTSGTAATAADCASRCEAKFMKCGGDAASAKSNCASQVCNANPTGDQLTCLENKSCDEIMNAMSFASLCPGSASTSGGTSGATSGGTSGMTTTGVTCGSATCGATQYCTLSYDSSAMSWSDGSCKAIPTACTTKSAQELCTCMQDNSGCPTGGLVTTKCSQTNGGLKFGCQ